MTSTCGRLWAVIPALLPTVGLASERAHAQERTAVQVVMQLVHPSYRAQLTAAESTSVEHDLADSVVQLLRERAPYLRYQVDSGAPFRLTVVLDRRHRGKQQLIDDVGLHGEMTRGPLPADTAYWMSIRNGTDSTPIGGPVDIVTAVSLQLRAAEIRPLERLLYTVPLARAGEVWGNPIGWVLPYHRAALCMDTDTRLKVVNEVQTGAGPQVETYASVVTGDFRPPQLRPELESFRGNIFSRVDSLDAGRLAALRQAIADTGAKVVAVYLVEYHFQPTICLRPQPPEPGGGTP